MRYEKKKSIILPMRYAIFGDIHGNLEAFETVLEHAASQQCESYVCLGDIVGYGGNPVECLEKVREMGCPTVKGNHDEDSAQPGAALNTNPIALKAQEWTYNMLSEEQREWLLKLRYVRQIDNFTIVHSSLDQPSHWNYVTNKFDAAACFAYQYTQLCFVGHSHVPQIYIQDGGVQSHEEYNVNIEDGKKYLINVGSVGQPRDRDWRASYAIYDSDAGVVNIYRLEYNVEQTQEKIYKAGLPPALAERLAVGS